MSQITYTIGVISDTHGLLRPEAVDALQGCDLIIHAGDVGIPDILDTLGEIAPVHAVRGNVDRAPWAQQLPLSEVVQIGDCYLYVLHDLAQLDLSPLPADFQAVISGHTHRPLVAEKEGVLYMNPGSAGPRRFTLPVTVGCLHLSEDGGIVGEIVELVADST